jgi:putative transposase
MLPREHPTYRRLAAITELTELIGAAPHQRSGERTAIRNGHRTRVLSTTAGDLELRIPKLRTSSFFPSLLERRRRVDQALFAVVTEAYLHGVSTRKVDELVKALGADTGISKSEVSRICADLDAEVGTFRDRSLSEQHFPYVFLDATYCKARVNRRVVSQAVVIATVVRADGWREVLGFTVCNSDDGAFWTAFCAHSRPAAWVGCSWWSPTPTPGSNKPSPRS